MIHPVMDHFFLHLIVEQMILCKNHVISDYFKCFCNYRNRLFYSFSQFCYFCFYSWSILLSARNQINATIDHRSFADQGITEQPTIHEGYIAQNMEKKGMIADRCEINRQIRADNKMLRELKAKVAKLTEAVEKSIPIIAETLEAIRNHMIFIQYHLLHNEMQKEVIHDWMNHFNPILNKYNTVKKELKAKVTERKELNVQQKKSDILSFSQLYSDIAFPIPVSEQF